MNKALRFVFVAAAIVVVIVLVSKMSGSQESPEEPREGDSGAVQDVGEVAPKRIPEVVRLVVRAVGANRDSGSGAEAAPEAREVLIGEYEHLGPVDPGVRDGFVSNCEQQIRKYQKKLARDVDAARSSTATPWLRSTPRRRLVTSTSCLMRNVRRWLQGCGLFSTTRKHRQVTGSLS